MNDETYKKNDVKIENNIKNKTDIKTNEKMKMER